MLNVIELDPTGYAVVIIVGIMCLMVVWYCLFYNDVSSDDDDDDIDLDPNSDNENSD